MSLDIILSDPYKLFPTNMMCLEQLCKYLNIVQQVKHKTQNCKITVWLLQLQGLKLDVWSVTLLNSNQKS